jgi:RND family efflux transporter MFP subunit
MKPVVDQGAVSPATWDAVRLGYDQAKVAVQQAEAALATTRAYAADTTVVAPFAGIVAAKKKNAGETVTMMPVTTIIVLQDISKIEVRVKLSENALTRVHAGEPMVVKFGALGIEKTVPIDRINPSVDPLNRTVELIGVIPNEDRALKAGMLVEVTFPSTAAKPQSTEVPAAAAPSGLPAKTTLSAHISSQPGRKP